MRVSTILCALLIGAWMFVLVSGQQGVCYTSESSQVAIQQSHENTMSAQYRCGQWWGRKWCTRDYNSITYSIGYVTTYYQVRRCCPGYIDYDGVCRRVVLGLESSSYTVAENAGSVEVCATVQTSVGMEYRDFNVVLTTSSGGAQSSYDYLAVSTILRLSPSVRRQCHNITINYDSLDEGTETFSVSLRGSGLPSYASLSPTHSTVAIQNIYRVAIGLERPSYTVAENASSVEVCAVVQNIVEVYSVDLSTLSGDALPNYDYSPVTTTLRLTPSVRRQCHDIRINYDYVDEGTETFSVSLSGSHLPAQFRTLSNVTIHNVYRMRIGFDPPTVIVAEDAGTVSVCARVYQHAGTVQNAQITMRTSPSSSGARSPHDFTAVSIRKTFTNSTRQHCIDIPIVHDYIHEDREDFQVTLLHAPLFVTLDPPTVTVYIQNDNRVTIGFDQTSLLVDENAGNVSVCVRILQPVGENAPLGTVNSFIVAARSHPDGSARAPEDYNDIDQIVTLKSSSRHQCLSIPIVHDNIFENTETFSVSLFRTLTLPSHVILSPDMAVIRIVHAHIGVTIGFDKTSFLVAENSANVSVCVWILQPVGENASLGSVNTFRVAIRTQQNLLADGARAHEDFHDVDQIITLTSSSRHQCLSIPIVHDYLFENTENFNVSLSRTGTLPSSVTLSPDTAVIRIAPVHRVTIGFNRTSFLVDENAGNVSVCVWILQPASENASLGSVNTFRVAIRTRQNLLADGARAPDDFRDIDQIITLTSSSRHQCHSITIVHDHVFENTETFNVSLSRTGSLPSSVTLSPDMAVIRITPVHRMTIGFDPPTKTVREDAGNVLVCVWILLPASESVSLGNVNSFRVAIRTQQNLHADGARAPEDFHDIDEIVTLTSSSRHQCLSIIIVHDDIFENTETFNVSLSRTGTLPPSVTLSPDTAVIRITTPVHMLIIGFEMEDYVVFENGSRDTTVSVCVGILSPTATIEDIRYRVGFSTKIMQGEHQAGLGDFVKKIATVKLNRSRQRKCIRITIKRDEDDSEGYECFTVELSRKYSLPTYVVLSPNIATITIYDPPAP